MATLHADTLQLTSDDHRIYQGQAAILFLLHLPVSDGTAAAPAPDVFGISTTILLVPTTGIAPGTPELVIAGTPGTAAEVFAPPAGAAGG